MMMQPALVCIIVTVKRIGQKRCRRRARHGTRYQEAKQINGEGSFFIFLFVPRFSKLRKRQIRCVMQCRGGVWTLT